MTNKSVLKQLKDLDSYKKDPSFAVFQKLTEIADGIQEKQKLELPGVNTVYLEGPPGKDGKDADEEKIIQSVLNVLPSFLPKEETVVEKVLNIVISKLPSFIPAPIRPDKVDVDEKKIISSILKKIKLPKPIDESVLLEKIYARVHAHANSLISDLKKEVQITVPDLFTKTPEEIAILLTPFIDFSKLKNKPGVPTYSQEGSKWKMRGGGDVVVAGSNVTITQNSDGTKTISAAAGGSLVTNLANQLDGVTKTFSITGMTAVDAVVLSSAPFACVETTHYTVAGNQITFTDEIDASSQLLSGQSVLIWYH